MKKPSKQHSTNLVTLNILTARYGLNPLIQLDEIAEEFLKMSVATARRKANNCELPFPVVRLSKSQKSPYVVHISELASYIDRLAEHASARWEKFQLAA